MSKHKIKDEGAPLYPYRVVCECSTVTYFKIQTDRVICRGCKHWVYRTPGLKFRYKAQEEMQKVANEKQKVLAR